MTFLLALGWPVALLAVWRWAVNYRLRVGWMEAAETWREAANVARETAERFQANADAALKLADDWKNAALVLQAALLAPLQRITLAGKVQ